MNAPADLKNTNLIITSHRTERGIPTRKVLFQ